MKDKRTRKVKKLAPSHSASTRWARLWPRPWNSKCLTPSIHHWVESIAESVFLGTDFTSTWFILQRSHPVAKHGPKVPVCDLTSDSDVGKELLIMLLPRKFPGGWGKSAQDPGTHVLSAEQAQRVWAEWVIRACVFGPLHLGTGLLCVPCRDLPYPQTPAWRRRSSAISWPSFGRLKRAFYFTEEDSRPSERFSHLPKVMEIRGEGRGSPGHHDPQGDSFDYTRWP